MASSYPPGYSEPTPEENAYWQGRVDEREEIQTFIKEWLPRIQEASNNSPNRHAYCLSGPIAKVLADEMNKFLHP